MLKFVKENWDKVLLYIKSRVEETAFQTWFDCLEVNMVDEDSITLLVPNRFHYEWLESKYRHLINDALKNVFNKSYIVNYSVLLTEKTPDEIPKFQTAKKDVIPPGYHRPSNLNDRYVFENFVEGKSNQFARAAAMSVTGFCIGVGRGQSLVPHPLIGKLSPFRTVVALRSGWDTQKRGIGTSCSGCLKDLESAVHASCTIKSSVFCSDGFADCMKAPVMG